MAHYGEYVIKVRKNIFYPETSFYFTGKYESLRQLVWRLYPKRKKI